MNDTGSPTKRTRGRPPQISLAQIVAVASTMDLGSLTMQAVADELDVRPAALYYHVRDRDSLLDLVAADLIGEEFSSATFPVDDWRAALRAIATSIRDGMLKTGVMRVSAQPLTGVPLEPIERTIQALLSAGFTLEEAGQVLRLLSDVAYSMAASEVLYARQGHVPYGPELRRAVDEAPPDAFPMTRAMMADPPRPDGRLFGLAIDALLAGIEETVRGDRSWGDDGRG